MKKKILFSILFILIGLVVSMCQSSSIQQKSTPEIRITSLMESPVWALQERKLFALYDSASRLFAGKYLAENGYMRVVERWGGNDGPDDVMDELAANGTESGTVELLAGTSIRKVMSETILSEDAVSGLEMLLCLPQTKVLSNR